RPAAPGAPHPPPHTVPAGAAAALSCAAAARPVAASACAALWLAGTAEFAWARIAPGPRTRDEIVSMALTSALIPPVATWHWLGAQLRHRRTPPLSPPAPAVAPRPGGQPVPERVLP
ncbi:transferase, partial [Streptomyces sp. NPDC006283]